MAPHMSRFSASSDAFCQQSRQYFGFNMEHEGVGPTQAKSDNASRMRSDSITSHPYRCLARLSLNSLRISGISSPVHGAMLMLAVWSESKFGLRISRTRGCSSFSFRGCRWKKMERRRCGGESPEAVECVSVVKRYRITERTEAGILQYVCQVLQERLVVRVVPHACDEEDAGMLRIVLIAEVGGSARSAKSNVIKTWRAKSKSTQALTRAPK